jgi:hypothetical protein
MTKPEFLAELKEMQDFLRDKLPKSAATKRLILLAQIKAMAKRLPDGPQGCEWCTPR